MRCNKDGGISIDILFLNSEILEQEAKFKCLGVDIESEGFMTAHMTQGGKRSKGFGAKILEERDLYV